MDHGHYRLGTVAASEAIIRDLYLKLRHELFEWSQVTFQTPQPKMGYVGQHLASVVTGFPGGRSGARGKDLVLPDGEHAEIKTCYRVDQLGSCSSCGAVVASVELECAACGSDNIRRKDDSKWLISPKHDDDMRQLFDPRSYFLVLFDFVDMEEPDTINARIFEIDPRRKGFAYGLVDYYFTIKSASRSGAPFNLWPFSLKFQLMEPTLIYHAQIDSDNRIVTLLFPNEVGLPVDIELDPLTSFSRSTGFTLSMAEAAADAFGVELPHRASKAECLAYLETDRRAGGWNNSQLVDVLCEAMYAERVKPFHEWLPRALR